MRSGQRSICVRLSIILTIASFLSGCAKSGSGGDGSGGGGTGGGGGSSTPDTNLSGNWQFSLTAPANPSFSSLSGPIYQEAGDVGDSHFTTGSFLISSSGCFSQTKVLDFQGFITNTSLQLNGFPTYSQTVTLNLTKNSDASGLSGSYTVSGGCADHESGSLSGVLFQDMTGVFNTAANAPIALQMTVQQTDPGSGAGGFVLGGKMVFTGASCLSQGTILSASSYVSGKSVHLLAATDEVTGAQATMDGTIDQTGHTLTIGSISIPNSSCLSSLNGAVLTR